MKRSASTADTKVDRYWLPAASLVSVLVVWQAVSSFSGLGDYVLPSPAVVASTLWSDAPVWATQLRSTLVLTLVGFGLSLLGALSLGIVLDQAPRVERFVRPLLVLSQTIPAFFLCSWALSAQTLAVRPTATKAASSNERFMVFPLTKNDDEVIKRQRNLSARAE